jgi:hypothetical protein
VTSRAEPQITRALSSFIPKELLAYEAKNRADVEVYLRTIARRYIKGEANIADIEADVKRTFKFGMLQAPVINSSLLRSNLLCAS